MSGRSLLLFAWLVAAYGCDAAGLPTPLACARDQDCPGDRPHCAGLAAADHPAILPSCPTQCFSASDCPTGFICAGPDGMPTRRCAQCVEACQTAGCAEGFVCAKEGDCRFTKCDEIDAPPCPDGWRCDPTAAETNDIGAHSDPNDSTRLARGCARNPCGEENGAYCADLWRCDPEQASVSSGCVPLPCSDTGHCSSDAAFICTPTNTAAREAGTDPHGCVHRNCSEGAPLCNADQLCDEGVCRPRTCAERECAAGSVCMDMASGSTCVFPAPSTGGTSGNGGASSTGGSTSAGGAPAAGSSAGGFPRATGHCE